MPGDKQIILAQLERVIDYHEATHGDEWEIALVLRSADGWISVLHSCEGTDGEAAPAGAVRLYKSGIAQVLTTRGGVVSDEFRYPGEGDED